MLSALLITGIPYLVFVGVPGVFTVGIPQAMTAGIANVPPILSVGLPQIALYALFGVAGGLAVWLILSLIAAFIVYFKVLHRWTKRKWSRECSSSDERQHVMYKEGLEFISTIEEHKREVQIKHRGLKLYGEYYDLGFDRTAVIISGRTEGLKYAYFFAKPYAESGFNIFVYDQRAHGMSDGHCNTLGFKEAKDLLAWCRYLHDELGTKQIYLHGICIGSACGLYALTNKKCPDYIVGLTADGMYSTFFRSFVNHALEKVDHLFPVIQMVEMLQFMFTGTVMRRGPIHVISGYKKPLLMLHSREDTYSIPKYAVELYGKAGSNKKELIWFDHGAHSMLRITDTPRYDAVIKDYLKRNFSER